MDTPKTFDQPAEALRVLAVIGSMTKHGEEADAGSWIIEDDEPQEFIACLGASIDEARRVVRGEHLPEGLTPFDPERMAQLGYAGQ